MSIIMLVLIFMIETSSVLFVNEKLYTNFEGQTALRASLFKFEIPATPQLSERAQTSPVGAGGLQGKRVRPPIAWPPIVVL